MIEPGMPLSNGARHMTGEKVLGFVASAFRVSEGGSALVLSTCRADVQVGDEVSVGGISLLVRGVDVPRDADGSTDMRALLVDDLDGDRFAELRGQLVSLERKGRHV